MTQDRIIRRMIRRDTHSSRSVPSIVAASILLVTFLWLALESVLWLLKDQPLLASPAQLRKWLLELPANTIPAGMTAAGVGLGTSGAADHRHSGGQGTPVQARTGQRPHGNGGR